MSIGTQSSKEEIVVSILDLQPYAIDDDGGYKFDLSTVTTVDFKSLIKAIGFLAHTEVKSINIVNALRTKNKRSQKIPNQPLKNSAINLPKVGNDIVTTLEFVLSHSFSLKTLTLQGLDFSPDDLLVLSNGLKQNQYLQQLTIDGIQLVASDFDLLVHCIDHLPLTNLSFIDCDLDDYSIPALDYLLKKNWVNQSHQNWKASLSKSKEATTVSLTELNLSSNRFSHNLLLAIQERLVDLPLAKLDLRKNLKIEMPYVQKVSRKVPHIEILVNRSNDMPLVPKKQVFQDNEFLPGVIISGPNSAAFCKYFSDVLIYLEEYDQSELVSRERSKVTRTKTQRGIRNKTSSRSLKKRLSTKSK